MKSVGVWEGGTEFAPHNHKRGLKQKVKVVFNLTQRLKCETTCDQKVTKEQRENKWDSQLLHVLQHILRACMTLPKHREPEQCLQKGAGGQGQDILDVLAALAVRFASVCCMPHYS